MTRNSFEQLVREAVQALPENAKMAMENVAFVVEKEVRRAKARETGIRIDEVLLGLYEGIPNTERGSEYFGELPSIITIFQKPLEELAGRDKKKLKKLISETIWHEVGHHLGFDEKGIRALEAKKLSVAA